MEVEEERGVQWGGGVVLVAAQAASGAGKEKDCTPACSLPAGTATSTGGGDTTAADVDAHTQAFEKMCGYLIGSVNL